MAYQRRKTTDVKVGEVMIGSNYPIRVQSMANTSTMDTEGSVAQAKRIMDAGGEIVRFTTQGQREALNMKNISEALRADGCQVPLVADVHFNAAVADTAATICEKVRINPGNYVDPARTFKKLSYTDEEYADEIKKIDERFVPFLNICKEHHTAIRIGVNHGSLSDRIMSRYGDTPEGMGESCMEFLRICVREKFPDVVISIKASNTVVMVRTVRLLVAQMAKEGMAFPLHLGVTEAGEGEDGRIKSAVGIGALLCEGIGDTIRVSLSEAPEREIPVAKKLVDSIEECAALREQVKAAITNDIVTVAFHEKNWEDLQLKASMTVGKEKTLKNLYAHVQTINEAILERDGSDRMPTPKEADILAKLAAAIDKLENETGIRELVSSGIAFLSWLRNVDPQKAIEFTGLWDAFLKEKF